MTLLHTKCKWCRNVQDTSAPVPKCLRASAPVPKCLGFLRWCRSVYWTFRHQCRNVLGPKCPYTIWTVTHFYKDYHIGTARCAASAE